ncbi:MAG: hypothetical protein QM813_15750 [Verrucomicrobiota bacterium]
MNTPVSPNPHNSIVAALKGFAPWQQLKSKNIAYLTLPLLIMATVVEFVILATGWKYQQAVCLPQGMGVTFFGIGPIGATILAVELLKLPLAIWTASRAGWAKTMMLCCGLPLICLLTFQLVKDMAVYEMGAAMKPASEWLEKAAAEETKISQLNAQLNAIQGKKTDREAKLAEFAAKKAKAKAELEEELKRNDQARNDAISLTEYQTKELSTVEARQAAITRQFDIDAAQLGKAIADLRARRESEVGLASKWNAEEARIENAYKTKLAAYTNKKNAYEKDKEEYQSANILKRQLMREPVNPGVPPEREVNTILKPTQVADLDAQIKAKEAELVAVNNKRRESVALVAADAQRIRQDFDRRSQAKREESDKRRTELLAAQEKLNAQLAAEEKELDQALGVAVGKVDDIRAEVDAARKRAEGHYEAREAAIRSTQVHRIATTVEIVRGLLFGERPLSINASAKERGDALTDQISMVRIWVYPVLAFIVAFLPTLMVEVGFSTLFKPDSQQQQRPQHRLGFLGRRLHAVSVRAGRLKIARAERMAREAATVIATRDQALATAKASAEQTLAGKEIELRAAREATASATTGFEQQLKLKEAEWVAKFTELADSLNRAVIEKDSLRDLQKTEVERQVQMRQNAWADRVSQLSKELDEQRAVAEAERTTLMAEQQKRLLAVTEECKAQVLQARRQMADAQMEAVEKNAKLSHDLKEALHARDAAEFQAKQQAEVFERQLAQTQEDGAREVEKVTRQEKYRFERQQLDFDKTLRQRTDDFEHRVKQQEHELSVAFESRLAEEKAKIEQDARERRAELERELETRAREVDAHWNRELQQRETAALNRLKQRELQLGTQAETRLKDVQTQAEELLRRREAELSRQLETQERQAETRLKEELQQKELTLQTRFKQREQELISRAAAREAELKNQSAAELQAREQEWEEQSLAQVRSVESRATQEAEQKEESYQLKLRQREQQLQVQFDARQAEIQAQRDRDARRRELEFVEAQQREQHLVAKLAAQAEAHQIAQKEWATELEIARGGMEPLKALLVRTEKERDEARAVADEGTRMFENLRKKSIEASTLLNGWENRDNLAGRLS